MFTFQDARVVNFDPVLREVYFPSKEELMSDRSHNCHNSGHGRKVGGNTVSVIENNLPSSKLVMALCKHLSTFSPLQTRTSRNEEKQTRVIVLQDV